MGVLTAINIISLLFDIAQAGIQGSPMPLVNRLVFGKLAEKLPAGWFLKNYRNPGVALRKAMRKMAPEELNLIRGWVKESARWRRTL